MRMALLIVIAACGKSDAPTKPVVVDKPAPPVESVPPPPPPPAAFTVPGVDTSPWKRTALSKLGKAKLPFEGAISLPPGAKTKISELHTSDGKNAGQMIFVDLPDRLEVMLGTRSAVSEKDPTMLKQVLSAGGPFLIDREQGSGYMLVQKMEDGYIVQGASWAVEPGLDCATRDPATLDQLAVTLAICDSFAAK